ncbi:glycosyltransferase [uncultured Chryseobacterium sp.]|uniref:glycosyltransferase n=1 Tax=uncultured Chryseobacterium sp. TaxID=259322 RepID=UPI0027DC3665|nr:glycosyltransferase [uncultured Chryseobacterium sp.]
MKKVLIYIDPFIGHIIPTLGLSEKLIENQFDVHYCGVPDVTEIIARTQFSCSTIFEEYYPKGTVQKDTEVNANVISSILNGELDELINEIKPSILIMTAYNPVEAAAFYYKYKIKIFLLYFYFPVNTDFSKISFTDITKERAVNLLMNDTNMGAVNFFIDFLIREGHLITSLKDVLSVFDHFYNIIISSPDFLTETPIINQQDLYIGDCLPKDNILASYFDIESLKNKFYEQNRLGKKLIYFSLGSWADQINYEKAQLIIQNIIKSADDPLMDDYVILIAAANLYEQYKQHQSDKIIMYKWVPQMEILHYADIAILHGGMGGIKHSIMNEIPMIIVPLDFDQSENADRVVANRLGAKMDAFSMSAEEIVSKINEVQNNDEIKLGLKKMKNSFEKISENNTLMSLINAEHIY